MKKENVKSGNHYTCFIRTPVTDAILNRCVPLPELEISEYGDLSRESLVVQYANLGSSLRQLYDYVATLTHTLADCNYIVACDQATDTDSGVLAKLLPRQALRYATCRDIRNLFTIPYNAVVYAPCDTAFSVDPAYDECLFCDTIGEQRVPEGAVAHQFAVRAHQFITQYLLMTGVFTPQQVHYFEVVIRKILSGMDLNPARNLLCVEKMVNFCTAVLCYAQFSLSAELDTPLRFDPTYFCAEKFVQHMYELAESV